MAQHFRCSGLILFLICVFFFGMSTPLHSQTNLSAFQFKKVGDVRIRADGPVDAESLLSLIEITPNVDIVTTSKIRKSIELLYATGNFTNILVDAVLENDRVALTFILRKVYRIESIKLVGQLGISGGKIGKRLGLRKFEPYTPEKVLRGREDILAVLRENGYYNTSVRQDVSLNRIKKQVRIEYLIRAGAPTYVVSVDFTGQPHFPESTLLARMKSKPGKRFKIGEFNRDLEKIEAHYDQNGFLEHDIRVVHQEMPTPNQMQLGIHIDAGKQLLLLTEGYLLSDKILREQIPIWSEHSYNDDTLEEGKRNLTEYFQSQGYHEAAVSWSKDLGEKNILITYTIHRGRKYKVDEIVIEGNSAMSRDEILDVMLTKESKHELVTGVFDKDLERIISAYRERGYLFAHITERNIITRPNGLITINLQIEEGPLVTVSEIRLKGNNSISTEFLSRNFKQKIGEAISESKVKTDSNYIVALYSDRGFAKVQLENRLLLTRDKTRAIVEYRITEGDPVQVSRIVVSGDYRTERHVIEENLLFEEDDPFSLRKIFQSQSKLYSLNVFDRVEMDVPRPENLQDQQDVRIRLTESRPYTVSYGIGYQTFDLLRGTFSISNRNLFGTARSIGLALRGGFKEARALLTFTDPHLFFHRLSSTVYGIAEHGVRTSYEFTRYAATLQVEKKLTTESVYLTPGTKTEPAKSIFYRYAYENIDTTGAPPLDPINRQFLAIRISSLAAGYVRDARDNPIDPSKGNYLSLEIQYAASFLGSEPDFLKSFNQFNYFIPFERTVIGTSLRIGLARGFKGVEELPLSQRFFAGGGRTIRGFELDTAGPLDPVTGDPIGGNALFILNLEYRFPIAGNFGAITFFDYGNVFSLISDFEFSELRKTSGVGLRYKTPIGPVTLDWGYKLDRRRGESPSEFFLSVGHAF
jgi:outer membrane protein insertion porin family